MPLNMHWGLERHCCMPRATRWTQLSIVFTALELYGQRYVLGLRKLDCDGCCCCQTHTRSPLHILMPGRSCKPRAGAALRLSLASWGMEILIHTSGEDHPAGLSKCQADTIIYLGYR